MQAKPITPLFTSNKLEETLRFYREHLGFITKAEMEGYAELEQGAGGPSLAFMAPCPEGDYPVGTGAGLMFCFPVEDADAEHARLVKAGVNIRETPQDRPWAERAFVALDPNGISLYFGHPIDAEVAAESAEK